MYDIVVIGGGPAGLSAAYAAYENGAKNILIIERDNVLGGILNQCIHSGFGLHRFNEELTGPEYAQKYIDLVKDTDIEVKLDTMVLDILEDKMIHITSAKEGYQVICAKTIILAMGCRERTRGAISIAGDRCSGVFTAGAAQRIINIDGHMVGKKVVILGSGDIGLIMARRMTLEGAKVLACIELMPYSNGLTRNIVQCLDDFDIPLYLSSTVTNVYGDGRLEYIEISEVDANRRPIAGTERTIECDTLLLSVGLLPENELIASTSIFKDKRNGGIVVYENMETSVDGIFACGNVVHVHDLVDFVSLEGEIAGKSAAKYVKPDKSDAVNITTDKNIIYSVPQKIRNIDKDVTISFRANKPFENVYVNVMCNGKVIKSIKKAHILPAEMEKITVNLDQFNDIQICISEG